MLSSSHAFLPALQHWALSLFHPLLPILRFRVRLMNDPDKGETEERETSPLQIDPKWYVRRAGALEFLSLTARINAVSGMLSGRSSNPSRPMILDLIST